MMFFSEPSAEKGATSAAGRRHWLALAAVIALGAMLRLACLQHPTLWGDEAATYNRVWGSYERMLSFLANDGFVPLHYELYWVLARFCELSPWQMRLVPALMGILMVPAIYLLGRQLVRPQVALLAATLAATSAFLLTYSRDAKMYMESWTLLTLHAAAFLWWARGGEALAWWCWVAAGVAAVGLHSTCWLAIAVEALIFSTSAWPKRRRLLPLLLGALLLAAGPLGYYYGFNRWIERSGGLAPGSLSEDAGNWSHSGVSWIQSQDRRKSCAELTRDSACAFALGYSQAEQEPRRDGTVPIQPWVRQAAYGTLTALAILALLSLVAPPPRRSDAGAASSPAPWRMFLWLTAWLVLPTYGLFYCRSVPGFVSPLYWGQLLWGPLGWQLLWLLALAAILLGLVRRIPAVSPLLAWLAAGVLVVPAVWMGWRAGGEWHLAWLSAFEQGWMPAMAAVLALPAAWQRCASTDRQRWQTTAKHVLAALVVLLLCAAAYALWAALWARSRLAHPEIEWKPIWMPRYLGCVLPAFLLAGAILLARLPKPLRWLAVSLCVLANLAQFIARLTFTTDTPIERVAADVVTALGHPQQAVFFYDDRRTPGAPAESAIGSFAARYYLYREALRQGLPATTAQELREERFRGSPYRGPVQLAREISRRPQMQQFILWYADSNGQMESPQALLAALGSDWKLDERETWNVYRFWNWQFMCENGRLRFQRASASPQ